VGVGVGVNVAVAVGVAVGVGVGVGAGQVPQYLPPVFNKPLLSCPPQTIICLSAQTAVCSYRPLGGLVVLIAIQLSVVGLYRLPVFK
jgi:hypothetical protein